MSYTANNTDASAVAQRIVSRANATSPSSGAAPDPVGDNGIAIADAILDCVGYLKNGQSDGAGLGTATTTSSSFADVGDGATTGFATWTISIPVVKTYLLHVGVSCYCTVAADTVRFQVLVDGTTTGVTNPSNAQTFFFNTVLEHNRINWVQPIAFQSTGNKVIKLQWKRLSGTGEITVNTGDFRLFTLQG